MQQALETSKREREHIERVVATALPPELQPGHTFARAKSGSLQLELASMGPC